MDSAGDVTKEQIENKPIWVIPVSITYNGQTKLEFYDITPEGFWKDLNELDKIPTTAQITPNAWLDVYRRAASEGYTHAVVVTLSSTASGIYSSAVIAKKLYEEEHGSVDLAVLDSLSYSFLYGSVVLKGYEKAAGGSDFAETVSFMKDCIDRTTGFLWVYALRHLKKSGRISGMASFVGDTLGLRPILKLGSGVIAPVDRVRGDKNILPRVANLALQNAYSPSEQDMTLLYADVPREELERAREIICETLSPKSLSFQKIGPSIAINTGPQAMALMFYGNKKDKDE